MVEDRSRAAHASGPAARARVLVADDRADARAALCAIVVGGGNEAIPVGIGGALAAVDAHEPQVALVRVDGSEGAGIATAALLARRTPSAPHVIAVCGDADDVIRGAFAVGVNDVLIEPLRRGEVLTRIRLGAESRTGAHRTDAPARDVRRDGAMSTALAALTEGLLIVGGDGRVWEANAAMTRLVGRPVRDIIGMRAPYPWWPAADAADLTRLIDGAVVAGGGDINAWFMRADGAIVPVEMRVAVERGASQDGYAIVVRDLSEQIRHRNALQSARREQASLRRVATAVAGEPDVERVFSLIATEMAEVFAVECGVVLRFVNEVAVVAANPSAQSFYSAGAVMPTSFDAAVARLVTTGAPTRVAYEYLQGDSVGDIAREAGAVCSVAAPIRVAGDLWGAALISTRSASGIADERARLAGFADMVGLALETAETRRRMEVVATIDELTGLPNRRAFDDAIVRETERARRYDRNLTLVMFDIDRLGQLNAAYGHDVGDETIIHFATLLTDCCRLTDMVARTGGAEFVCLMPDTEAKWGSAYAERVRRAVADAHMPAGITCSVGVAQWRDVEDAESVVARAGQALYRAKHQGRDRVALEDPLTA